MKQHITTIKHRAIDWIFKRIHFVARDSVQQFDLITQQLTQPTSAATDIAVLRKSAYVRFDKRYKVISQKELKGIVSNELDFHSPFQSSYALYKIRELAEGSWQVTYYYVDLKRHPELANYRLVLIWDEFISYWLADKEMPISISTPIAQQYAVKDDGVVAVSDVEQSRLKKRIMETAMEQSAPQCDLSAAQFADQFFQYLLAFPWLALQGAVNRGRWLPAKQSLNLSPKQMGWLGAVFAGAMFIESAWLLSQEWYFEQQMQNTAELREQYSVAKNNYLNQLDRFAQYAIAAKRRSGAASVPQLLSSYGNKADIRIDRMDYLQGEVRLGGVAGDIEAFMAFLSQQEAVHELAFMSPITQDKRTGKDRFSIRFDWHK